MIRVINNIKNWLFPEKCIVCDCEVFENAVYCPKCFSQITRIESPFCEICGRILPFPIGEKNLCESCANFAQNFNFCRALFVYDFHSKKIVMKIKKQADMDVARKCCLMLTSKYERFIFDADFIIPVPSFWTRTLRRGFNPADIIAIELSKNLNIPLDLKALKRIRKTEYQKNKTKVEREKNIENAFLCEGNIRGKKILLIDDVMTTGTTLNECAKALKMAGASVVVGLTIASTKALK